MNERYVACPACGRLLRLTERGLQSFPDEEFLWYLRAEAQLELDQYAAAKQSLDVLFALPSTPRYSGGGLCDIRRRYAPRVLANVYRLQRSFAAAEATLRTLLADFPDDTLAWYLLGWIGLDTDRRPNLEEASAALAGAAACWGSPSSARRSGRGPSSTLPAVPSSPATSMRVNSCSPDSLSTASRGWTR